MTNIDFTKPHSVISKEILKLPFAEQQAQIDLWLEQPDIKVDLERKRTERMKHPEPINMTRKTQPDQNWQD